MKYYVFSSVGKWLATLGIWLIAIGYAQANVIVEDLGGNMTKVTIDPIVLTASAAGEGDFLVIEDFWAVTSTACGLAVSSTMSYSINGGPSVFPHNLVVRDATPVIFTVSTTMTWHLTLTKASGLTFSLLSVI